jgi:hypothetical protein
MGCEQTMTWTVEQLRNGTVRRSLACSLLLVAALSAGCGSGDDWSAPHPKPVAVGRLGAGFYDPKAPPAPEAMITPRPGSWDAVHPSKGYRVVLLSSGDGAPTRTLVEAVKSWAGDEHVSLKTVVAGADPIPGISKALSLRPDLIVSAGDRLVDPLAIVTANHLNQQFLVVGAELAEPTANVTAADWTGAGYRGEGLGMPSAYDASSFTPERAGKAIRAGVAAVLNGLTGIVLRIT